MRKAELVIVLGKPIWKGDDHVAGRGRNAFAKSTPGEGERDKKSRSDLHPPSPSSPLFLVLRLCLCKSFFGDLLFFITLRLDAQAH